MLNTGQSCVKVYTLHYRLAGMTSHSVFDYLAKTSLTLPLICDPLRDVLIRISCYESKDQGLNPSHGRTCTKPPSCHSPFLSGGGGAPAWGKQGRINCDKSFVGCLLSRCYTAQWPVRRRWAQTPRVAMAYASNFTFTWPQMSITLITDLSLFCKVF